MWTRHSSLGSRLAIKPFGCTLALLQEGSREPINVSDITYLKPVKIWKKMWDRKEVQVHYRLNLFILLMFFQT